ncbi:MAG: helix-turn-helix transcriptional regulator [Firmicutes bacterium]|nr:helix-turn-helix transcriptional regulator [Bacillota bacterium]
MDFEKTGKFIAKLRKDKKLTQLQLAELIGASDKTISKWENGNSFPDLIYQSKLCTALDIELDELHAGELNFKRRKRRQLRKIFRRLVALYAAITIPLIIFLCLFFVNNYDSTKIYKVINEDSEIKALVSGVLVETNKSNMLYIGPINIWDYEIKETDMVSVDIYSKNQVIFHTDKLDYAFIKYDEENKIKKDFLKLIITITDKNKKEYNYELNLTAVDISNEDNQIKLSKISELKLLNEKEIIKNLKADGFKQVGNNWKKKYIKKGTEYVISYFPVSKKLNFNSLNDTINQNITLFTNSNILEVYIYNKNSGKSILFEKYSYNYLNQELDCQVGVCSTLENVLETMQNYIILLTGE